MQDSMRLRKTDQAIAALLTKSSVAEAARTIGIHDNTLLRWLEMPEFAGRYEEARKRAFSDALTELQNATGAAVKTVLTVMRDKSSLEGTRLRAALAVIDLSLKNHGSDQIAKRLAGLERQLGLKPDSSLALIPTPTKRTGGVASAGRNKHLAKIR